MEYEKWFKPYENLTGPQAITEVDRFLRSLERFGLETGIGSPPSKNEKWWQRIQSIGAQESGDLRITFDYPYTDPNDYTKYEGKRIHYPFRTPSSDEIIKSKRLPSGAVHGIVEGFGDLFCTFEISQAESINILNKKIYPFGLFLRTPSGIFYSISGVKEYDEERELGSLTIVERQNSVYFGLWKPNDEIDSEIGKLFVPVELPTLQSLEFRLGKLDEGFIYENIDFFTES